MFPLQLPSPVFLSIFLLISQNQGFDRLPLPRRRPFFFIYFEVLFLFFVDSNVEYAIALHSKMG